MKKLFLLLMSATLLFQLSACTKKIQKEDQPASLQREEAETEIQKQFDEFLLTLYTEEVSSDALTLHYSLVDPSVYGIELNEISLGSLSEEELQRQDEAILQALNELEKYDPEQLNASQKNDYAVLKAYLEIQSASIGINDYSALFSPATSLTSNLITNFVEFRFYKEEDLETYLTLLEDVERYLDEALDYTADQVAKGWFLSDQAVTDTTAEITKFVNKIEDNELILSFNEKLEALEGVDDAEKTALIERNQELVITKVIPAYEKVKDQLLKWQGARKSDGGLASFEGGKAYYEALLRYRLGYQGSLDTLFQKGEEQLVEVISGMVMLLVQDEGLYERYLNSASSFPEQDPEMILKNYQQWLLQQYPEGPEVSYTVEYLDPSIANASTIAYYLIPPLDQITENVIKINPEHTTGDLQTLYTTLAHEGFPGHCYQNTFFYNTNPHPIRTVTDFLGYGEGWAMMVELDALDWILSEDPALSQFLGYEIYYGYLIQSLIDIGVNYYGWDRTELLSWLESYGEIFGLNNEESADLLFDAVVADPSVLTPYGIGMMEMVTLRQKAKEALKEKFDEIAYHQLILKNGPMTFDLLEEKVEEWIAAGGQ